MKHLIRFANIFFAGALIMAGALQVEAAGPAKFQTTDTAVQRAYEWARKTALSYVHNGGDPVGKWYEAALPGRDAFCMRDLSHQVIAAELLGLSPHNVNMLGKVAANISEEKDWCSYWEIDKLNRPAPCDYGNDKEFWYNLPANFDVVRACYGVYEWTGDMRYIADPVFVNFYEHTVSDYAERWNLSADSIMSRRRFMNTPEPFNPKNGFHSCRGLPSYAENFSGITVAIDLLGAIKKGYEAYGKMCALKDRPAEAERAAITASRYGELIDSRWWDDANSRYNTYYKESGDFHRGEGVPYLLLIDAIDRPERAQASVADVLSRDWNVENFSAFPVFLYRLGHAEDATRILTQLPTMKRSDYPEVSFGVIEGIFHGLMGIEPSASNGTVTTCYRGSDESTAKASDVPLLGGKITVTHQGHRQSTLTNNTKSQIKWEAAFIKDSGETVTRSTVIDPGKTATLSAD